MAFHRAGRERGGGGALPLAWRRFRIGRTEGALLFAGILVYTVVLIRSSRRESRRRETDWS